MISVKIAVVGSTRPKNERQLPKIAIMVPIDLQGSRGQEVAAAVAGLWVLARLGIDSVALAMIVV